MKTFNINWVQILFHDGDKEKEMMFCAGGKYMPTIKGETNKIFDLIEEKLLQH